LNDIWKQKWDSIINWATEKTLTTEITESTEIFYLKKHLFQYKGANRVKILDFQHLLCI
jgi:hypothetical protein